MAYLVTITSRAERDLAHLYEEINAEHSYAALRWRKAPGHVAVDCASAEARPF